MRDWKTEINDLVEMSLELLAVIGSNSEWTIAESDKLKRLKEIVSLLEKVKKLAGDVGFEPVNPNKDAEIISRFLARQKNN